MSHTLSISFSDAVIRRHIANPDIRQLKDPRYPLRLRFNAARTKGSWHVVKYADAGTKWRKVGTWPELSTKAMLASLPDIQARLAVDPQAVASVQRWETVGELLIWHRDRITTSSRLSRRRKTSIKSAINKHLLPALEGELISNLSVPVLDERLVWPMQARYSVSYVRLVLSVMKGATKQASSLGMLAMDPLVGVRLTDFLDARVRPKPGKLRAEDLADVFATATASHIEGCVLMLMVLLFGTRITETRLSRWDHIDLERRSWWIPAEHTKSKRDHRLPLTDVAVTLFRRYREAQHSRGYRGVYLFPGKHGRPVSASTVFAWVSAAAQGRFTSHDLRKLARTCWADLGVDYMVGELLLNHALTKLDRTYIHTYAERQSMSALTTYHEWLRPLGMDAVLTETIPRHPSNGEAGSAPWWHGLVS